MIICLLNSHIYLLESKLSQFLTGGVLLSRDKEFIVLYRGKDFLPAAVSSAIEERRKHELGDKGKGANKNFPRTVVHEHEQQTSEDVCEDENNSTNDETFELSSEERNFKSAEAAIERTHAKLSEACVIDGHSFHLYCLLLCHPSIN